MVIRSANPSVEVREVPVNELMLSDIAPFGDNVALINGETKQKWTSMEVVSGAKSIAAGLQAAGMVKGDVALIAVPNCPEYALFMLGILEAGGVASGVNVLYTEEEVAERLVDAKAKFILSAGFYYNTVRAAMAKANHYIKTVYIVNPSSDDLQPGRVADFKDLLHFRRRQPNFPFVRPKINPRKDLAFLPYSSGTTGKPKGVMLTHFNSVASMTTFETSGFASAMQGEPFIGLLPFFHAYGQMTLLLGLRKGATLITMIRFDPQTYLQAIQDYKIWMLSIVPPLMVFLAKDPLVSNYDLSSLKIISVGAAPVGKELIQEFRKRHPYIEFIAQGYGMTEMTVVSHFTPLGEDIPDGSCGTLVSNWEGKVIDLSTGADLGPNKDGEICVRSDAVMKGYFNRPDATADTIDKDGWLHTGDIGHYDEKGYFFIVDRLKELIKVRGFQVPPAELEDLLLSHPLVREVAVVGIPDEKSGEVPKAFVVRQNPSLTEEMVKDYVAEKVAPYKRLKAVSFVKEIPRSQAGKLLRRVLRDQDQNKATLYSKL